MTMPTMHIVFQHSIGWDARYLIARVTGRPVHVATVYDGVLYEASFGGYRAIDAAARMAVGQWEAFEVPTSQYSTAAAHALARSRVGARYDFFGALVAWWLGRPAGPGARSRYFCSETGGDELLAAGVPLLYRRTARYTPRHLRDEVASRFTATLTEWQR